MLGAEREGLRAVRRAVEALYLWEPHRERTANRTAVIAWLRAVRDCVDSGCYERVKACRTT